MLTLDGGEPEPAAAATHAEAARAVLAAIFDRDADAGLAERLVAIGHRVVHGGRAFRGPTLVTERALDALGALAELAPLHNPPALAVLGVARERFPDVAMVAVFDTTFFRALPEHVRRYAVPASWHDAHAVERFGFHGIAHAYLAARCRELDARLSRVVSLQLGQGCSATALLDGRPVETSMGLTPLEGLIMATRSGDLDPGVVVHMARRGWGLEAIDAALNRESGLRGLSGTSGDVRELLELERAGDGAARLALRAFCHRVRKYVGAYAAALGGLDGIVFGGGIGEHSAEIRARVCSGLEWLGLELDAAANARCSGEEAELSAAGSRIAVWAIPVNEERAIARAALDVAGATAEHAPV